MVGGRGVRNIGDRTYLRKFHGHGTILHNDAADIVPFCAPLTQFREKIKISKFDY